MEAPRPSSPVLVCLYEDRPYQIAGLKVLLLSLERYCPSWPIRLRFPDIPAAFRAWLQRLSQVSLYDERLPSWGSYDVKPSVLLDGLSTGAETCLWLDTDILVNRDPGFIAAVPPDTIVVTQDPWEYHNGSTHRCASWGLTEGRPLPGPINSAVVRVTKQHAGFLEAWRQVLLLDAYVAEQTKPVASRNHHLLSDQDALSALLASDRFAAIPVRRLAHSTDILQHHGAGAYRINHRWSKPEKGNAAVPPCNGEREAVENAGPSISFSFCAGLLRTHIPRTLTLRALCPAIPVENGRGHGLAGYSNHRRPLGNDRSVQSASIERRGPGDNSLGTFADAT